MNQLQIAPPPPPNRFACGTPPAAFCSCPPAARRLTPLCLAGAAPLVGEPLCAPAEACVGGTFIGGSQRLGVLAPGRQHVHEITVLSFVFCLWRASGSGGMRIGEKARQKGASGAAQAVAPTRLQILFLGAARRAARTDGD